MDDPDHRERPTIPARIMAAFGVLLGAGLTILAAVRIPLPWTILFVAGGLAGTANWARLFFGLDWSDVLDGLRRR
jgi:hypothetical protein